VAVKLTDKVYNEGGAPVQGAIAQAILTNGTTTAIQATDTTDSKGIWAFDSGIAGHQADLPDPATGYWYDVRVNVGMQYRYRYGAIKAMMNMVQIAQTIVLGATQSLDVSLAALRVPAKTADQATPLAGQMVFRTDTKALRVHDGTTWYSLGVPVGAIVPYGGSAAPPGFLLCDGTPANRTTYAQLFAVLGTSYGAGDGSTTFGIPDLRGRTLVGAGTGTGLTARTNGQTGGEETHALTNAEAAPHTHAYTENGHTHDITDVAHGHAGIGHSHTVNDTTHGHNFGNGPILNLSIQSGGPSYGVHQTSGGGQGTTVNATGITSTAQATQAVQNSYTGIPASTSSKTTGMVITATPNAAGHNVMQPYGVITYLIKAT